MTDETLMASQAVKGAMNVAELVEAGLTPAEANREMQLRVFGRDCKFDRHGKAIEQGIGAQGNPSINHFNWILKNEGQSAYEAAVAEAKRAGTWPPKHDQQEDQF
jgi:hypothetical protein